MGTGDPDHLRRVRPEIEVGRVVWEEVVEGIVLIVVQGDVLCGSSPNDPPAVSLGLLSLTLEFPVSTTLL